MENFEKFDFPAVSEGYLMLNPKVLLCICQRPQNLRLLYTESVESLEFVKVIN